MSLLRVFAAIPIPESHQKKIGAVAKRFASRPNLRFVEPAAMHLTLNFIGDAEDRELPKLCRELSAALKSHSAFEIELTQLGAFPNFDRPRVFWVGVQRGSEELIEINSKFRDIIEDSGFLQEKRYLPHVTIARTQHRNVDGGLIEEMQASFNRLSLEPFSAKNVIVFNSLLEKKGPTYIRLATMSL